LQQEHATCAALWPQDITQPLPDQLLLLLLLMLALSPDNDGGPLKQNTVFYLPKVSRTLKDTYGRNWPGNPAEAEGNMYTKCWDSSKEIIVRMIDTCPCTQVRRCSCSDKCRTCHSSSRFGSCSHGHRVHERHLPLYPGGTWQQQQQQQQQGQRGGWDLQQCAKHINRAGPTQQVLLLTLHCTPPLLLLLLLLLRLWCFQVLPDGAPGVKPGGEVRKQLACCGGKGGELCEASQAASHCTPASSPFDGSSWHACTPSDTAAGTP
jgi:hypothetical protein